MKIRRENAKTSASQLSSNIKQKRSFPLYLGTSKLGKSKVQNQVYIFAFGKVNSEDLIVGISKVLFAILNLTSW